MSNDKDFIALKERVSKLEKRMAELEGRILEQPSKEENQSLVQALRQLSKELDK
ncbi:hypothetical protein JCM16358_22820 [Halanaerocella petrolearia]